MSLGILNLFGNWLWIHFSIKHFYEKFIRIESIHDTFCALALNPVSFSRIHYESTLSQIHYLFLDFTFDILSFSLIYCKFAFFSFEFAMDSLFNTRIHLFCFANSIYIKNVFREIGLNQRSISRIHFEYTISFVNFRWIHYLFRKFTLTSLFTSRMYLNPLFLSWIHYKFAFLFKFSIYFADWIRIGFFGEETMNSLLVSRIIYELSLFFCEFTINSIFFHESTLNQLSFPQIN